MGILAVERTMSACAVRAPGGDAEPRPSGPAPSTESHMRVLSVPESRHIYLVRLTKALRERGHDVREAPYPYLRWPRGVAKFARGMAGGPDIVHMHWSIFDSRVLARIFFRTKVPKVWTVHNIVPHKPLFGDDLAMTHVYLDRVRVAVWHSRRNIEEARRLFASRGLSTEWSAEDRIIPLMNFNGAWPDTVSQAEARSRIGIRTDTRVIGHFAPTLPYKGTRLFLEAFSRLSPDKVHACIFGECHDPALAAEIRNMAKNRGNLRIHLDPIRDEELQYWFKACDVVVQPYSAVTTSGSIYFPIAFKRPVIATPLGNIPDVIEHGVTGWLARDAQEVSECIETALADPQAARAVGERAHTFVDRTANIQLVADAYEQAYESAIAR